MVTLSRPSVDYNVALARNHGLGQLFLNWVQQQPSKLAVLDRRYGLTYEELHCKAVQLAYQLHLAGFEHEEPVGIVVRHGIMDVVSQLAIIYAGGSCATMDPTLPDQQIEGRLKRLGAKYILVDGPNLGRNFSFQLIVVDDVSKMVNGAEGSTTTGKYPVRTTLEHRTHLIHTSATTGEPKAVQIAARSVLEVAYYAPFEPVQQSDVVAHTNNTSFDVALFDIWAPLLQGAQIAVIDKAILLDIRLLAEEIERLHVTFLVITAALLNLAASTYPQAFVKLRMCWAGGEAANVAAIRTIFEAGPPGTLINAYGPTECCVLCTAHQVTADDIHSGAVSIGKPIGLTVARICDESGNTVDSGQEGELWIGGPCVSPGYFNRPEQNSQAFVIFEGAKDCSSASSPIRMYRTGDIVKQRSNGQIDYIGRRDNQVKIRGFRIELETIEAALVKTGQISQAVALKVEALQEGAGSMLVAFVVPAASSNEFSATDAVQDLKKILPDYMIPRIEVVSSMPLNNHAKVDRKKLSQLYRERAKNQVASIKKLLFDDKESIRSRLAYLWAGILGFPAPFQDDDDDFFQLGGTSLQAALLINHIERNFGSKISLMTLYGNSTLRTLSTLIEQSRGNVLETVQNDRSMWVADTMLADNLPCPPLPAVFWRSKGEGRVFITGATGFLGAFLLADLLKQPDIHQICCLVRASDATAGFDRLRQTMTKYGVWENQFAPKLVALCGHLEDQWLGLGPARFEELGLWASVIFHLGARVNYTQPYLLHRPANTEGTINVVRLACTGRTKTVHYISSISCFGPTGTISNTKVVREDESLMRHLDAIPYDHGYAQSQWVVEQLLRRLIDRQFPIVVYRPGFITGHSKSGACNPDDFFSRLINGCIEMGCYPELPRQRKEFVPVDWVTAAILCIASIPNSPAASSPLGHAFHLVPPRRSLSADMDDSMEMVSQAAAKPLKRVPYNTWIKHLTDLPPARLLPLQPMLAEKVHQGRTRWELYENMPIYDTTNTEKALETYPGGLEFPTPNPELMKMYMEHI